MLKQTKRTWCGRLALVTAVAAVLPLALAAEPEVDSRGPVRTPGMDVRVSAEGVQATNYTFTNRCRKPTPWQAQWIWLAEPPPAKTEMAQFRKEVVLPAAPTQVLAWLSADVFYRLYVNGRLVSRGPADIGRDYDRAQEGAQWLYDFRELTPYFHAGTNVVAAEVFTTGFVGSRVTRKKNGFLFEAEVRMPGQAPLTVKTDSTWRSVAADWRAAPAPALRGWRLPGYEDASWPTSAKVQSVWTPLAASELPPLMEARYPWRAVAQSSPTVRQEGERFLLSGDGSFTLQFDRVLAAYPTLKVKGGAGAKLTIIPGELPGQKSRIVSVGLGEGVQEFEYPFLDSFSVLRIEATNVTAPLEILDVGAVFSSYPVAYKGAFECSDPALTRLWAVSRWLTQICMQTHHLDSPNHQEPICDPGDYLIESLANYYAFGEPWLARQDLRKFGGLLRQLNYRNFHTSYSLLWLQMLMAYYDYTGDRALVIELAPQVNGLVDTFTGWRGNYGLISEAPNYMFMDWVTIGGFGCHHPPAVIGQGYMTAFYYRALQDALRVAEVVGDRVRANRLRSQVAFAFNHELWSPKDGLYRDGRPFQSSLKPSQWLPADKDIETFSTQVNTLAVLYDLAPKRRQEAIMDALMARPDLNAQPYFMFFVFEALNHAGKFGEYGVAQMKRWQIVEATQSYHEMWDGGDLSHAWGAAPMIQMSASILGVRPLTPGFATFEVRPQTCGLDWARGVVPTPHGPIAVSWIRTNSLVRLDVTVPAGSEADLITARKKHVGPGHYQLVSPDAR
jgi:alpha-L-rhamnosidase